MIEHKLNAGIKMGLKIQYLLNPKIIKYSNQKLEILSKYRELLKELGFDISVQSEYCTIHVVPFFFKI
ncbi:hypothetical protein HIC20_00280 [Buchnera aphidicola (Hormaphis cornu)]|nr:hypothetical protein HIC20_00280 [Buchnera aphidicola (Hormaphis cornu)]